MNVTEQERPQTEKPVGQRRKVGNPNIAEAGKATRWKPGQPGNPSGVSAKQRALAALDKKITKTAAEEVVDRLLESAKRPGSEFDPSSTNAIKEIHRALGIGAESNAGVTNLMLVHSVVFQDRPDGDEALLEMRQPPTTIDVSKKDEGEDVVVDGPS